MYFNFMQLPIVLNIGYISKSGVFCKVSTKLAVLLPISRPQIPMVWRLLRMIVLSVCLCICVSVTLPESEL